MTESVEQSSEDFLATHDETQRRIREFEDISFNQSKFSYDILRLHDQNLEYRVDRKTRNCTVGQPRRPFRPIGVPPDGKFVGEGVIGAAGLPGESVTVASFGGTIEGVGFFITVTYPDCFPVEQAWRDQNDTVLTTFYDLMNGISDPELFLPPPECKYDRERGMMVRGAMVYDEVNKRISEFEDETFNKTRVYYMKIKLYMENKEYCVDLKTGKCNVTTPSPSTFRPYGVPPGAKYEGSGVLGAAGIDGESVTIANFAEKVDEGEFGVAVTEPSCFPVGYAYFSEKGLEETRFYDLQEGITKPDAFDIPKQCM